MPLHHLLRVRRGATPWKEGMDHFWRPSEFNMTRGFKVLEGIDPGVYTPNLSLLFLIKTLTSTQQTYWSSESNNRCSPKIVPKWFFFFFLYSSNRGDESLFMCHKWGHLTFTIHLLSVINHSGGFKCISKFWLPSQPSWFPSNKSNVVRLMLPDLWSQAIKSNTGTSLVVQWLRIICPAMQGTQVRSLVRKLRSHMLGSDYCCNYWACVPQLECLCIIWKILHDATKILHATCSVAQSYPTLCDHMNCSLPGSSAPGIILARTLERVAFHSQDPNAAK